VFYHNEKRLDLPVNVISYKNKTEWRAGPQKTGFAARRLMEREKTETSRKYVCR
jgi:hypothetical protein